MKNLLFAAVLCFSAAVLRAGDPVHIETTGYGKYKVSYSSVTVSSTGVVGIPPAGNSKWREIQCIDTGMTSTTLVHSRIDDVAPSTTTLNTAGSRFPFIAMGGRRWNTSRGVYFDVGPGASSVVLDCEIWTER